MKAQFTMSLLNNNQRPIVILHNWKNVRALIDTGSKFPIWTASEEALEELGGKLIKKDVSFSGFGGKTTGNLYQLNTVVLGELVFPNMHIISCSDMGILPFQMILSATMFRNLIYEIDDKNHKLNVAVPSDEQVVRNLVIEDSNGRLHVLCNSGEAVNEESANTAAAFREYYNKPDEL